MDLSLYNCPNFETNIIKKFVPKPSRGRRSPKSLYVKLINYTCEKLRVTVILYIK